MALAHEVGGLDLLESKILWQQLAQEHEVDSGARVVAVVPVAGIVEGLQLGQLLPSACLIIYGVRFEGHQHRLYSVLAQGVLPETALRIFDLADDVVAAVCLSCLELVQLVLQVLVDSVVVSTLAPFLAEGFPISLTAQPLSATSESFGTIVNPAEDGLPPSLHPAVCHLFATDHLLEERVRQYASDDSAVGDVDTLSNPCFVGNYLLCDWPIPKVKSHRKIGDQLERVKVQEEH